MNNKYGLTFLTDSFFTFSTQITCVILGIIYTIVIARVLGPSDRGAFSLVIIINTLISMIGNSGIAISNIYFGRSKKTGIANLTDNSIFAAIIIGIPLSIAFFLYYFLVHPSFLTGVDPKSIIIGTLLVPISLLQIYFIHILLGQNRIKAYNINNLIQNLIFLLLILLILFIFKAGLFGVILSWATSIIIASVLALIQVGKTTRILLKFDKALFIKSIAFGIKGHLGNLIQTLNYRLNMFIIAFFMTTAAVGYFSVSITISEILLLIPGAIGTVILVRTADLTNDEANRITPIICRTTLLVTTLSSLILLFIAKPIIVIFFGSEYLPAIQPLYILLPGIVLATFYRVLSNEMMGRGKPLVNTIIAGVSLIATISLNVLLIPKMGLNGAALASTLAYGIGALVTLILFKKISGNNLVSVILITKNDLKLYFNTIRLVLKRKIKTINNNQ